MTSPAVAAPRALLTDFQPATFLERGATVPFTSPLLQQARIRLGLGGTREIVLRNPSGGPGWYVVAREKRDFSVRRAAVRAAEVRLR
jgi:hypothetical protein